jgi:anti-sigma factor RsiW
MSEAWRLPQSECECARGLLAQFVDDDLAVVETTWLRGHLEACAECRAASAAFAGIDSELTAWGERVGLRNPPPPGAREQLAARLAHLPDRRRTIRWVSAGSVAIAAAIAAMLMVTVIAPHKRLPAGNRAGDQAGNRSDAAFVGIPYLPPLDPHENATIVRMNIRVATLIAVGYRVTADPETVVPADVLVGEDGRAHAVRVLSGIDWNGTGD